MQNVLGRAFNDTRMSLGLTWITAFRSVLVPGAAIALIAYKFGIPEAMSKGWGSALYFAAFVMVAVLPLFFWNLWLTPYKILYEQLDKFGTIDKINYEDASKKQLFSKLFSARREMKIMSDAIKFRQIPSHKRNYNPLPIGSDHEYSTLKNKYSEWFPKDQNLDEMKAWIDRTISVLEAYDYEEAYKLIEQAATRGSWNGHD